MQNLNKVGVTWELPKTGQTGQKAVTACVYSLPPHQEFLTFLGHSPFYEFYETMIQIFPRKTNAHEVWLQI